MEPEFTATAEPVIINPAPNADVLKAAMQLGFTYVRYDGLFELFAPGGASVFMVNYDSWRADPEAADDNLWRAVLQWARRRAT